MKQTFTINTAATITASCGGSIYVSDKQGQLWYFRAKDTNCPDIVKFNLPKSGTYSTHAKILKIEPLQPVSIDIDLPAPERNFKPVKITYHKNANIKSPARIFAKTGRVEMNSKFYTFPPPVRIFILLHEQGHLYYKTEEYCDKYAVREFLKRGYNPSTAIYALTRVLTPNPITRARIIELLKTVAIK
jgi:hypothetical protein